MTKAEKLIILSLAFFLVLGLGVRLYMSGRSRVRFEVVSGGAVESRHSKSRIKHGLKKIRKNKDGRKINGRKNRETAFPVNLNTAGPEELESLPFIGRSSAEKIVDYREASGPFKEKNELLRVEKITISVYRKIEPYLTLE